jgi:hypothetical protein
VTRAGLGLLVGAILYLLAPPAAAAQDTTAARADSLRAAADSARARAAARDSVARVQAARRDSLARAEANRRAADSIKAPLARSELPPTSDVATVFQYDRAALFASGALTLGELLDHVPGVTVFRTGWIGSVQTAATLGDFARVRVFYDGVELDPLDPRMGGMHDFARIEIYQLEAVRIERGASETRVHLRSWRARSTTPETRVDVATGDLETNAYRAFYAKRFERGQALQLALNQYSTRDQRNGGDADNLSLFGRVGFAKKRWSLDASVSRTGNDRDIQNRDEDLERPNLPRLDATRTVGYARLGYGDPDTDGFWAQAIASTQSFKKTGDSAVTVIDSIAGPGGGGPGGSLDEPDTLLVSTDTSRSRTQYVTAVGWTAGPVRLSVTARTRTGGGFTFVSPSARAAYERQRLAVSLYAEQSPNERNALRTEAAVRFLPLPFLAVGGSVSRFAPAEESGGPTTLALRGEVGLNVGRLWASGGVMTRDTAHLTAPIVYDTAFVPVAQGRLTGYFATLSGKVWRDVGVEFSGVRYSEPGIFRPQYQTRSELFLNTSWPGRFPSGNLNILLGLTHEYRSRVFFPLLDDEGNLAVLPSTQYRAWGAILEIKLLSATLSYQYRNFLNELYSQVPGYQMPRPVNFYGVRWTFFN